MPNLVVWKPGEERIGSWTFGTWPTNARQLMFWLFAFCSPSAAVIVLYRWVQNRFYLFPLLQSALVGPLYWILSATIWALAAIALWKGQRMARGLAIIGSLLFFVRYFGQFLVPVRPAAWHYNLLAVFFSVLGLISFLWPDEST
jgi:hypothetical protein